MGQLSQGRFSRRPGRGVLLPLITGGIFIALLLLLLLFLKPEALSPDEILAKQEWTDAELQGALARSVSPAMAGQRKKEVLRHLDAQLKKRSPAEQEAIRKGAVVAAVTTSLNQIRKMPEKERNTMLATIQTKAEASYAEVRKGKKARKMMEEQLKTADVEAFTAEVNRVILTELTPAEKVQFAPITRIWIKTMKTMGR